MTRSETTRARIPGSDDSPGDDLGDRIAGLAAGGATHTLRHRREKVVAATQGSYDALFDPALRGLTLIERLLVALYACRLTPAPGLAAHYRERLQAARAEASLIDGVQGDGAPTLADGRLRAILAFTRTLIEKPVAADKTALLALPAAGLATPAVVALAQLIAFLSYQVRLVAGLRALSAIHDSAPLPDEPIRGAGARPRTAPAKASAAANSGQSSAAVISAQGFTSQPLGWKAWLDVVDLGLATPVQIQVLEESHPQAMTSDYYRLLVHQPEILRHRSAAFNTIMYAPNGMARAERELGATVTSRANGCVYCASVHAQRFEQLARRNDVILQVFEDPQTAGGDARERAIVRFSLDLTARPGGLAPDDIRSLGDSGLQASEILDLIHSVAIFAWANRLMLNLGEPVFP